MSDQPQPRILCIEDNPVNWRLVSRLLGQAGFECHWAEEGLKGFDMALALRPDMVLLDINLPGLSGYEVAAKFRNHPELSGLKIVALTAKTLKSERETALVAGCDGFIPKPIDPFTFVNQVSTYLGGKRDAVEQGREGPVLRQLNVQVLEHLESQLKEAQDANAKLLKAQRDLENRNRSLDRLLGLSRTLVAEHEPQELLRRILMEVMGEFGPSRLVAFRRHESGGYWQSLVLVEGRCEDGPVLPTVHSLFGKLQALHGQTAMVAGDRLRATRLWDEGVAFGCWSPTEDPCLLLLQDRQEERELKGFWLLERDRERPWQQVELEFLNLYASLTVVNLENAELIESLNHSSRALASSYERMEAAYQDLNQARANLLSQDRQLLISDLFNKMSRRIQTPVAALRQEVSALAAGLGGSASTETVDAGRSLSAMTEAIGVMDGLIKALSRRTSRQGEEVPEWLNLKAVFQQELELLHADLGIDPQIQVTSTFGTGPTDIFGVYGDFAKILAEGLRHSLPMGMPPTWIRLSTWTEGDDFHLEILDDAGVIPPSELDHAFKPFSEGPSQPVMGVRYPSRGLVGLKQVLASYHGEVSLEGTDSGTRLHCWFPMA